MSHGALSCGQTRVSDQKLFFTQERGIELIRSGTAKSVP